MFWLRFAILPVNPHSSFVAWHAREFDEIVAAFAQLLWTAQTWDENSLRSEFKVKKSFFFWDYAILCIFFLQSCVQAARWRSIEFIDRLKIKYAVQPFVLCCAVWTLCKPIRESLTGGYFCRWSELRVCADAPELSALCCAKCCWVCLAPPGEIFGAARARVLKGATRCSRDLRISIVSSTFLEWLKRFARVVKKPSWKKHILIWVS